MALSVRRADVGDAELLWRWRNDPLVRQNSFNTQHIPWADHELWFAGRVTSPDSRIYVLEERDTPVAQIRYERRDHVWAEVGDISVVAGERGKGYGRTILVLTMNLACEEFKAEKVLALVKKNNVASAGTFRSAGFDYQGQVVERDCLCMRFIYSCALY